MGKNGKNDACRPEDSTTVPMCTYDQYGALGDASWSHLARDTTDVLSSQDPPRIILDPRQIFLSFTYQFPRENSTILAIACSVAKSPTKSMEKETANNPPHSAPSPKPKPDLKPVEACNGDSPLESPLCSLSPPSINAPSPSSAPIDLSRTTLVLLRD